MKTKQRKFSPGRNFAALALLVVVSGCQKQEVHDVQWFLDHAPERTDTLKQCRNNPGELRNDANCINAIKAEKKLSIGKF